ncbi:MAG: hypothetical protein ACM3X7_00105 [Solirubrobacterales bacterium]
MDRRKINLAFCVFISCCILGLSFYYCFNRLKTLENGNAVHMVNAKGDNGTKDSLYQQSRVDDIVSKNSKIIFRTNYKKSGGTIINREQEPGNLVGKTKQELEAAFSSEGYQVSSMSDKEVILERVLDRYEPNKYVLGIKDGHIAIFKTDKEGNMFIQDDRRDITDIKTDKLKDEDIKLLTNGDKYFQCGSKEEAQAILEDYE